jgi:hypothetical protein
MARRASVTANFNFNLNLNINSCRYFNWRLTLTSIDDRPGGSGLRCALDQPVAYTTPSGVTANTTSTSTSTKKQLQLQCSTLTSVDDRPGSR